MWSPGSHAPPLTVAHRAGNRLETLRAAALARVDYAEADVWFAGGRLVVQHDSPASAIHLLRSLLRRGRAVEPSPLLTDLLTATSDVQLLLDLKGSAPALAESLAAVIKDRRAEERVAASGQWSHLDRLAELVPQVPLFYSVGNDRQLADLRKLLERRAIRGVSIDRNLLTEETVVHLKMAGVECIVAWVVQTLDQARRLLAWGVNGITSDNLTLLTAIRGE